MKLSEAEVKQPIVIASYTVHNSLAERLMEHGATIGSKIVVIRKAPFHGLVEILVNSTRIAIRKHDADSIEVNSL